MDYEKKYKELVGQIKKAHLYAQTDSTKAVLEDILPELKENEDEKIRKYILSCCEETIKANDRGLELSMETTIKLRDWLEKQGDQKPKISSNYFLDEYVRFKECAIKEKHSKENPYSGVSFEYNGHTWGMCARDYGVEILVDGEIKERVYLFNRPQGKSALETLKEEKVDNQNCANPTNKVEPKFKVGDWVVDKEGYILKIMRVDNCFNHIIYACRFIEQKSVFWSSYSENDIRLWDITEDAKDGDVLASNRSIFIFSQEYIAGKPEAHCGIMDGFFIAKPEGWWTNEKCYPATKEQRYFLFGKMREAGYEWDAEKKELKKIEQNPAWSEEDEIRLKHILHLLDVKDDKRYILRFGLNSLQKLEKDIAWLRSIKSIVRPKQKWSVCDEDMLNDVEESLEAYSTKLRSEKDFMLADTVKKEMEWIKSLKERVGCEANCTTTKEWSEEDIRAIDRACVALRAYSNGELPNFLPSELLGYADRLQSLIPQNTWKPSDGQMKALNYVVNLMASSESPKENDYYYNVFKDLREQLKKLREE